MFYKTKSWMNLYNKSPDCFLSREAFSTQYSWISSSARDGVFCTSWISFSIAINSEIKRKKNQSIKMHKWFFLIQDDFHESSLIINCMLLPNVQNGYIFP